MTVNMARDSGQISAREAPSSEDGTTCGLHLAGWARLKVLLRGGGVWRMGKERGENLWGPMLYTHNQAILVTLFVSFPKTFRSRRDASFEHLTHPYSSFLPLYLFSPHPHSVLPGPTFKASLHLLQHQAYEQTDSFPSLLTIRCPLLSNALCMW